jgi:hypothetical protein
MIGAFLVPKAFRKSITSVSVFESLIDLRVVVRTVQMFLYAQMSKRRPRDRQAIEWTCD